MRLLRSSLSWPIASSPRAVAHSCRRLVSSSSSAQSPPANLPSDLPPPIDFSFLRAPMNLSAVPEDEFETTRDELAGLTESDMSGLSPSDVTRLTLYRNVFKRAAKLPTPADRATYFQRVDFDYRPKETVERDRRELAREMVASGRLAEKDALSLDEWEKGLVEREQQQGKVIRDRHAAEGQGSVLLNKRLSNLKRRIQSDRREGLLRREIISEMKEQAKEETGSA